MSRQNFYQPGLDSDAPQWFSDPTEPTQFGSGGGYPPVGQYPNQAVSGLGLGGGMSYNEMPKLFAPMTQQLFQDPQMANLAFQYGGNMMGQGAQLVHQKVEHYMSLSKLKYYFAVNNSYVGKKLLLLLFPFTHKEWAVKYDQQCEPVAPRDDVNAPDLYIPLMSFVTYVLVSGLVLGTQSRFSPEHLGLQTSSALGWILMEVVLLMLIRYLLQVESSLRYLDLIAYCGYKFTGMIICLLVGMALNSTGYYASLLWFGLCLAYFLIKTLRLQVQPNAGGPPQAMLHGNKRRVYLLLFIAFIQPILMWWLTRSIIFYSKP